MNLIFFSSGKSCAWTIVAAFAIVSWKFKQTVYAERSLILPISPMETSRDVFESCIKGLKLELGAAVLSNL